MKKNSYDLYVERKMKMIHLALGKKILTYLCIGLVAITLLLFALTEMVEQPQALLNAIPYSLAGIATCFIGILVLNSKLQGLKKKKKLKEKSTLEPVGYF
jgi:hypothetical protein